MTISLWSILFVLFLPIVLALISDALRLKEFNKYDNNYPREQTANLSNIGKRVWAAQQNSWEALIMYAPSVFVAHLAGVDVQQASYAAITFCIARVAHSVFYITNLATFRSISYFVALGCCLWLFWLSGNV